LPASQVLAVPGICKGKLSRHVAGGIFTPGPCPAKLTPILAQAAFRRLIIHCTHLQTARIHPNYRTNPLRNWQVRQAYSMVVVKDFIAVGVHDVAFVYFIPVYGPSGSGLRQSFGQPCRGCGCQSRTFEAAQRAGIGV
jgi:hypothetical protein